jgi:hypothetical protein
VCGKIVKDKNVNVHTDKWLDCELQRTDPTFRQRGRPTETRQQISDPNAWKGSNIWSNVHKVGSTPRHTDWLTDWLSAVNWLWLTKDRPGLSSERAPHRDRTANSRPKLLKRKQNLVKRPQSGLDTKTYWLTDWLTDCRKVTLTLTIHSNKPVGST